jgi:hypothetical protein
MHKIIWFLVVFCAVHLDASASYLMFSIDSNLVQVIDSSQSVADSIEYKIPVADNLELEKRKNSRYNKSDTLSKGQRDSLFQSLRISKASKSKKQPKADTSLVIQKKGKSPKVAALLSALLPGAGQVYNGSYWKLAVIYGGAYLLVRNMNLYSRTQNFYHGALILHDQDTIAEVIESDLENYVETYKNVEDYIDFTPAQFASLQQADIKIRFEDYRSTLQNMYVFSVVLYGLNILDAVVDAHLKSFDVSDNLSMKIKPSVLNLSGTYGGMGAGISIKLSLK